jgi:hypothetical protein
VATQQFMGKGVLLERLTEQLRTQKNPPKDPEAMARELLIKRRQMTPESTRPKGRNATV